MGLEPTRAYTHKILSLACLPIPALPHVVCVSLKRTNRSIALFFYFVNTFFEKNRKNCRVSPTAGNLPYSDIF